jgi:hypothetical protein
LTASPHQDLQLVVVRILGWSEGRAHCFGELGQDLCVDAVGLGETTGSMGKITDLASIDYYGRQACGLQSIYQACLIAAVASRTTSRHVKRLKADTRAVMPGASFVT